MNAPIGKSVSLSLSFFDQYSQPIAAPTMDAVPAWTLDKPLGTLTVAADGLSATFVGIAQGGVNITVDFKVGGKDYNQRFGVSVQAAAVFNSFQIAS